MKIAAVSNFDSDTFNEWFVDSSEYAGDDLQAWCDKRNSVTATVYYLVVKDNYTLQTWQP